MDAPLEPPHQLDEDIPLDQGKPVARARPLQREITHQCVDVDLEALDRLQEIGEKPA